MGGVETPIPKPRDKSLGYYHSSLRDCPGTIKPNTYDKVIVFRIYKNTKDLDAIVLPPNFDEIALLLARIEDLQPEVLFVAVFEELAILSA